MKNVTVNAQTNYKNKLLRPGDTAAVSDATALRWEARGIATITTEEVANQPVSLDEKDDVNTIATSGLYEGMKAKELFEMCKERGVDAEARQSAQYYVGLLEAADKASE